MDYNVLSIPITSDWRNVLANWRELTISFKCHFNIFVVLVTNRATEKKMWRIYILAINLDFLAYLRHHFPPSLIA